MTKKLKIKSHEVNQTQNLMTEQEQRMYRNKNKSTLKTNNIKSANSKNSITMNKNKNQEDSFLNQDQEIQENNNLQVNNLNKKSAEQITQFINKLIAKNKVSSKNAFDVPLIHLQQMADYRASLNENTWKRLSCTLQNDYKIYGYRVDATHNITFKMLQSIARHETTIEESLIKQGKLDKEMISGKKEKLQQPQNMKNKLNVDYMKHIEKNNKVLNVTQIQSFFSYNPGLQKTKRLFDQQGMKALLLNNIPIRENGSLKLDQQKNGMNNLFIQQKQSNIQIQIFNKYQDQIINENKQNQSVFQKIFNLNTEKKDNEQFSKIQRLYKIISGQQKQQRKRKKIQERKPLQSIVQQNNNIQNKIIQEKLEQNQNNLQSILIQGSTILQSNQKQKQLNKKQKDQNQNVVGQVLTGLYLTENVKNTQQPKKQDQFNTKNILQNISIENSNKINQSQLKNQNIYDYQNLNQQENFLLNKNFQMQQMKLDNLDKSSSNASQTDNINFNSTTQESKLKNIGEYINIKQPLKKKKQKKIKINGQELTSDQIGKRLFNRKYKKKQKQSSLQKSLQSDSNGLDLTSVKIENEKNKKRKLIKFNNMQKSIQQNSNYNLKRSVVFKKSLTEEKIFNQIKSSIKQKLQLIKQKQKQTYQKQSKSKKIKQNFIVQFPQFNFSAQDVNTIEILDEIDPQKDDITIPKFYKKYFPSFLIDVKYQDSERLNRHKKSLQEKNKQILKQKQKQNALKQELPLNLNNSQSMNKSSIYDNKLNTIIQQPNSSVKINNTSSIALQISQANDISILNQYLDRLKANNQVTIRDAKQKIKQILFNLCLYKNSDLYKAHNKQRNILSKNKPVLYFKQIYQRYLKQWGFITPALCFLTVLHLTNQNNFNLNGSQEGLDFEIQMEGDKRQINIKNQNKVNQSLDIKFALNKKVKNLNKQQIDLIQLEED